MRVVRPDPMGIAQAARAISRGRLVAYPTETFYGLATNLADEVAVARLLRAKGRAADRPLPLILPSLAHLRQVVTAVPRAAEPLMERYWPGPLTLVLPARPELPAAACGPRGVGVRISSHPVASMLARAVNAPLIATSANPGGEAPAQTAAEVHRVRDVELVVDGGVTAGGVPSTVVAFDERGGIEILRPGACDVR